jgi:hypothetical protein
MAFVKDKYLKKPSSAFIVSSSLLLKVFTLFKDLTSQKKELQINCSSFYVLLFVIKSLEQIESWK